LGAITPLSVCSPAGYFGSLAFDVLEDQDGQLYVTTPLPSQWLDSLLQSATSWRDWERGA